ncbi:BZ3500_MvSof-1268-A1-R1_Chr3-3g06543 [Microbotryum saponariae]|uniref:BZ3500_MvSof-1268-A1-R1_Chr3-3g06543 protein n=1 Tax=Microbotryum saponariae TaxID=289078 RepID=A0A2X0LH67_9BASI|nr:BZ3500_MvSof-1268-A1-R1_Chr3-3g06543 [Microbotryum saponariae]SDA04510.1 BZ3501_MvSof-1269-A2-R1_Chr3-2g06230 [Microbotryum saponariae]
MINETQDARMDAISDYGDELAWDDEVVASQLDVIESSIGAAAAPLDATQSTPPPRVVPPVEIQVENTTDQIPLDPEVNTVIDQEYEQALAEAMDDLNGVHEARDARSLWERYRKRRGWGALSVTDLVAPSWCEYQHTYRLASKSYLPPLERPAEILSKSGATITIDRTRTVAREKILDGGKAVHLKIEKQVMGDVEPVKVDVAGKEEWWALRFLNTIVCFETLVRTGRTREIPVTGFVGEFLVSGVIDEVERREIESKPAMSEPKTPSKPQTPSSIRTKNAGAKPEVDTSQRKLVSFFKSPSSSSKTSPAPPVADPAMPSTPPAENPSSRWGYIMSDTKTRKTPTLPYESESKASRLQLMLYHRLLTSLLLKPTPRSENTPLDPSPSTRGDQAFDWTRLYAHLSLDPNVEFAQAFVRSIEPILEGLSIPEFRPRTLGEVVKGLQYFGKMMSPSNAGRGFLEDCLEINYVMREKRRRWGWKKRARVERRTRDMKEEEDRVGRAMRESLDGVTDTDRREALELERALEMSLEDREGPEDSEAVEESQVDTKHEVPIAPDVGMSDDTLALPMLEEASKSEDATVMEVDQVTSMDSGTSGVTTVPLVEMEVGPRYNLRRRRNPSGTIVSEVVEKEKEMATSSLPSSSVPKLSSLTCSNPIEDEDEPDEHLDEGTTIGTHHFKNDPLELDTWLEHVKGYWNGTREAEGVDVGQTIRCRNCEFEDDCEWLKIKSEETLAASREKRRKLEQGNSK